MLRRNRVIMLALVLLASSLVGCSSGDADTGFVRDTQNPADTLTETKCSMCHTTERVYSAIKSADEWDVTMERMKSNGMVITDDEYAQILEYLSE